MDFEVPNRVHIMPVGYEKDRITMSADRLKADQVILIGHTGDGEEDKKRLDDIQRLLEDDGIEVFREECDIFDLYDSLGTIGENIVAHGNDDVYVNVSTGSKVTAIAGMIACMAIDATAYYAKAKHYSGDTPREIDFVRELPHYPIEAPVRQQIAMLYVIDQKTEETDEPPTKGELIHFGEHLGLPFITQHDVGEKGKYRALDNEVLDPLEEDGYITISRDGRKKRISLTEEGANYLRAFGYRIDDETKNVVQEVLDSGRIV